MVKLSKKIIISIALIMLIFPFLINSAQAFNPNDPKWDPEPTVNDSPEFLTSAGEIIGIIQYAGIIVSVLILTIIGIKYLLSSVEGKAEYKKNMLPYVLGCAMLGGICVILKIIEEIVVK